MKIGFVASCFDLLHAGHMDMLAEAGQNTELLLVGLHINPKVERPEKNQPIESLVERYYKLQSILGAVAFKKYLIVPYETEADLIQILKLYKPNVRFLGSDYKGKSYTGKELNIPIHWIDRSHGISSSGLRAKILSSKNSVDYSYQITLHQEDDESTAYQTPPKEELKFKYTPPKKKAKKK